MSRHRQAHEAGSLSYGERKERPAALLRDVSAHRPVRTNTSLFRGARVSPGEPVLIGPGLIGQRVIWKEKPGRGVWIIYDARLSDDLAEGFLYCIEKPGGVSRKCWLDGFELELA